MVGEAAVVPQAGGVQHHVLVDVEHVAVGACKVREGQPEGWMHEDGGSNREQLCITKRAAGWLCPWVPVCAMPSTCMWQGNGCSCGSWIPGGCGGHDCQAMVEQSSCWCRCTGVSSARSATPPARPTHPACCTAAPSGLPAPAAPPRHGTPSPPRPACVRTGKCVLFPRYECMQGFRVPNNCRNVQRNPPCVRVSQRVL